VIWLALPAIAAAAYSFLVIVAALRWRFHPPHPDSTFCPPVSILKPIHGRDPDFYTALLSHVTQDYPEFELIFGAANEQDPALADIERLRREYPGFPISLHIVTTSAPNAKTGVLAELARHARHPVLLINDSDIVVERGYLRAVTAPLASPKVGLVTCLYRARAKSLAAQAEALAIATEFAPSVLVARMLGNVEFALGSTMVCRAETLERIGGFTAIADYIADDYQLGRHITNLGLRVEFAPIVVETDLGSETFPEAFHRQVRWSRTIRMSRPGGYYGYIVTHATLWSLVALAAGQWWAAALAFGLRMAAALAVAGGLLKDRRSVRNFWMIPLRDLCGFVVWTLGAFGYHVVWRDRRLRLGAGGRIDAKT